MGFGWLLGDAYLTLWALHTSLAGCLFMVHPQLSYGASVKHVLLGVSMVVCKLGCSSWVVSTTLASPSIFLCISASICSFQILGSLLLLIGKLQNFAQASNYMVIAGAFFAMAACILSFFKEKPQSGVSQSTATHPLLRTSATPITATCVPAIPTHAPSTRI